MNNSIALNNYCYIVFMSFRSINSGFRIFMLTPHKYLRPLSHAINISYDVCSKLIPALTTGGVRTPNVNQM